MMVTQCKNVALDISLAGNLVLYDGHLNSVLSFCVVLQAFIKGWEKGYNFPLITP